MPIHRETHSDCGVLMQDAPIAPAEVWELIASYVATNPLVYSRLAGVSRLFYETFTSDKLWKFLTPFDDIRSGFYYQFILRLRILDTSAQHLLRRLWHVCEYPSSVTNTLIVETDDPDLLLPLTFIVCTNELYDGPWERFLTNWQDAPFNRSFILCAVNLFGGAIYLFPRYHSDQEMVRTASQSYAPASYLLREE